MLRDTIRRMEVSIHKMDAIPPKDKAALEELLSELKAEAKALHKTHEEVGGLAESVKKFETSHPELIKTLDEICRLLASVGI